MKDGFADLRSPEDLFRKLVNDHERMRADPMDMYAAFDFFVTAEHLIDWTMPDAVGNKQRVARQALREQERLLQITSHIANGAKHFRATEQRHKSVADVNAVEGASSPNAFSTKAFSPAAFSFSGIHVELDDGTLRHAYDLAEDVLTYWRRRLGL